MLNENIRVSWVCVAHDDHIIIIIIIYINLIRQSCLERIRIVGGNLNVLLNVGIITYNQYQYTQVHDRSDFHRHCFIKM